MPEGEDVVEVLARAEVPLRRILVARYGVDVGVDLTADVLVWAWRRPDRLAGVDDAVAFLDGVAQRSRRARRRRRPVAFEVVFAEPVDDRWEAARTTLEALAERPPDERVAALLAPDEEPDPHHRDAAALLDDRAARRVAARAEEAPRTEPSLPLAVAATVLVVLLFGAVVVAAVRSTDTPEEVERAATTTTEAPTPAERIHDLGVTGLLVSTDGGLVDLATGEVTTLVTPGDRDGQGSPLAVLDRDGGLFYLSQADRRSDLRHLHSDGTDEVVQEGVTSFARHRDGSLAMAVAQDPGRNEVVVLTTDGTRATWSPAPGGYHVRAWAGGHLLAERDIDDTEARDTVVFDGPGQVRDLAHEGAALAVGSRGDWVMVSGVAPGETPPEPGAPPAPARVLDLATGAVGGEVDIGRSMRTPGVVASDGGGGLVAATATADGRPALLHLDLALRRDAAPDVTVSESFVLDDRTFVPTSVARHSDGTMVALAARSDEPHDVGMWICRPGSDVCLLEDLPFGHRGQAELVLDPSQP
ncbi:MAG TPA: hypothetical protein VF228_13125 [Iamia sp.]